LNLTRLGLAWAVVVAACATPTPAATPPDLPGVAGPTTTLTVNVFAAAGLDAAIALDILEHPAPGEPLVVRARVSEAEQLAGLTAALDAALALQPRARCLERYRLRFTLRDGTQPEFGYACEGGEAWLRGAQPFWQGQDVVAPEAFRQQLAALLQAAPAPTP